MKPTPKKWALAAIVVLASAFLLGPRVEVVEAWAEPDVGDDPVAYLRRAEAGVANLRPGEQKAVVWADSTERSRTPLVVVYLHGFSADRHEIDPVPASAAAALGANLYYARLAGHGRDGAAMAEATVAAWFQDAAEAMAVATSVGDRVVLVGTSTGATLAVWMAAQEAWRERIAALVLLSPNFRPRDRASRVLLWPWGGLLARLVVGPERCFEPTSPANEEHWTTCYPTRALLPMMALVEHVRTMPLGGITAPALVFYSTNDQIVDPFETQRLAPRLGGTPVRLVVLEGLGDPAHHVLAGDIMSPALNDRVVGEIVGFVRPLASADPGAM